MRLRFLPLEKFKPRDFRTNAYRVRKEMKERDKDIQKDVK